MARYPFVPPGAPGALRLLLISTLGVFCASGAQAQTSDTEPDADAEAILECTADGYEILLTNISSESIPPGRTIDWNVPFVRKSGTFETDSPLEPNESVFVSGALGSDYLSSPQPCTATLR